MKKVLITGTNGFVGSHLLEYFITKKQELVTLDSDFKRELVCLIRKESGSNAKNFECENAKIQYKCVDYHNICDSSDVFDGVDYIFHLAGVTKGLTKQDFINGNVIPTENILRHLKKNFDKNKSPSKNEFKRFVYISSLAALGPSEDLENPKSEVDAPNPIEFYGESKLMAEKIVENYSKHFPITIIRPSAVYGEKDSDFLKIYKMLNFGLNLFYGNKKNRISMIYVKDLIDGIIKASLSEKTIGETYNFTNSEIVSWEDFQNLAAKILDKKILLTLNIPKILLNFLAVFGEKYSKITKRNRILNKQKIKMASPKFWTCSSKKAKIDFGFEAKTNLPEGLKKTLGYHFDL